MATYDDWKTSYPENDKDSRIDEMCGAIVDWRRSYIVTIESMIRDIEGELRVIAMDGEEDIMKDLIWVATSRLRELLDEFKDAKVDY